MFVATGGKRILERIHILAPLSKCVDVFEYHTKERFLYMSSKDQRPERSEPQLLWFLLPRRSLTFVFTVSY